MPDLSALSNAEIDRLACQALGLEPESWTAAGRRVDGRVYRKWARSEREAREFVAESIEGEEPLAHLITPDRWPPVSSDPAACARLKAALRKLNRGLQLDITIWPEGECQARVGRGIVFTTGWHDADTEERAVAEAVAAWGIAEGRCKLEDAA